VCLRELADWVTLQACYQHNRSAVPPNMPTNCGSRVCTPGATVSTRPKYGARSPLPPRNGRPLSSQRCTPSRDASITRHQQGFTPFARPAFPSPVTPQTGRAVLGLSPELHTPRHQVPERMSGQGQILDTDPSYVSGISRPPTRNHSQRATSCRNQT
jgi:hypothetical protein